MRNIKMFIRLILTALLGVSLLSGPVQAAAPIKIGTVRTMSDATSIIGDRGAQLAAKQINERGGLLGRRLEIVVADDEGKPDKAAFAIEKLATVDKVDFFSGGLASATTLASIPGLIKYGKVTLWTGASSSKVEEALAGQNWFFHTYPWHYQSWPIVYKGISQILQKYGNVKIKKIFMAYEDGPYGTSYFNDAKVTFEAMGVELRGESFKSAMTGGSDYRTVLKHAKEFRPDFFLWIGYDKDSFPILTVSAEIGLNPPLYGGWPPAWPLDIRSSPLSEGVIFFSFWDEVIKYTSKASKDFCDAYFKEYKEAPLNYSAAYNYSAIMILADAVKKAGSLDKAAVIKAMQATNYETATGDRYVFKKSKFIDHQTYPLFKIFQYQQGKVQAIWPWELATAKMVFPYPAKEPPPAEVKQPAAAKAPAKAKGK